MAVKEILLFLFLLTVVHGFGYAELWPSENLLQNPGLEGGDADGVRRWSSKGAGDLVFEPGAGRMGTQAAKLGASEGAFGLRTRKMLLPPDTKEMSFEVHVRLANSSPVCAAINWYADKSLLGTAEGGPLSGDADWTLLRVTVPAPRRATRFECVIQAVNHSGEAHVDDACARSFSEKPPPLDVLCNQAGYDASRPVRVLVQSTVTAPNSGAFRVLDANGTVIQTGSLAPLGAIPEWEKSYLLADIEGLVPGDGYLVEAEAAGLSGRSYPFSVGPDVVRTKTLGPAAGFYYYQRCGFEVPGWHAACHMDDARMPDGTHRDLTGGWHDAGDYNKYNTGGFTALSVYALAYAHERATESMDRHAAAKGLPSALEEAAWGADWLLEMEHAETGRLWGLVYAGRVETALYWGPPEKETDNIPGNEDDRPVTGHPAHRNYRNETASAALALLGRLTEEERYVRAAERFYGALSEDEITAHADSTAVALLACLELEKVRPEAGYGGKAKALAERLLTCQIRSGKFEGGFAASPGGEAPVVGLTSLGLPAAALSLYGSAHGDGLAIRKALVDYLSFSERLADNPFNISKIVDGTELFFFLSVHEKAHYVAQNSMYLMQAWALACAAQFTGNNAFGALATSQVDWVLGRNPLSLCMLEGQGSFNPPKYHHRYNSIPGRPRGAVPGTVCNGITKPQPGPDKPAFDMRKDILRPAFESNEPWIPHNAMYLLAVSSL